MDILGKPKLKDFWSKCKDAKKPLEKWIQVVQAASWRNFSQVRDTFSSVDLVSTKTRKFYVFNIGGNKYRLITAVNFEGQVVVIDVILTHKEYDKENWKN